MLLRFCQTTDGSTQLGRFERDLRRYTVAADGSRISASRVDDGRRWRRMKPSSQARDFLEMEGYPKTAGLADWTSVDSDRARAALVRTRGG
jgi:hypothetical protein